VLEPVVAAILGLAILDEQLEGVGYG